MPEIPLHEQNSLDSLRRAVWEMQEIKIVRRLQRPRIVSGEILVDDRGVRANSLLWIMFASYFTFGIILNVIGVVIPILIQQYQLSLFAGGLLAFAFFISFGVFSIPAGLAADRLGAKPIVVSGMFLMGIGCGAIPFATGFKTITLFAFVIGAGVALLQTAGNPLIGHLGRRENYHRNLTLTIGFCGIGAFAGPLCLSALLAVGQPWQRLYTGYAILCAVLFFLLASARFPQTMADTKEKLRLSEVVKLLAHPVAVTYFLAVFFYVGAEVGTASWIVKFFQQVHSMGSVRPGGAGENALLRSLPALPVLTVSLFWGLQGVGRLTSGYGIQKLGARPMLRLYCVGAICFLLVAIFASPEFSVIGFSACGFFTSVLITLLFSGAIHTFHRSEGAISGLLITASIGGAMIPPLVGLTGDHFGLRIAMFVPVCCFLYVFAVSMIGKAEY